jgi:hypothetical protein
MNFKEYITERELSIPEQHQKKIALRTLKMNDVGVSVMGGMNKGEARSFLKRIGYSDEQIKKIEESEEYIKETEGKNGYIAFYKGRKIEVYANSSYEAQKIAAEKFKAKKSYEVHVHLAEKDGKEVIHNTSEI